MKELQLEEEMDMLQEEFAQSQDVELVEAIEEETRTKELEEAMIRARERSELERKANIAAAAATGGTDHTKYVILSIPIFLISFIN